MTDTKMVLAPNKPDTQMLEAVFEMFGIEPNEENAEKYRYMYERFMVASPNQGKVTPEMVESIAMKLSPFSFSDDSHVSDARDKATRDYEKGIWRKATRSTVLKVIKALGLEVVIDD